MNNLPLPNAEALLAGLLSPQAFQIDESAEFHVYALWHRGHVVYVGMTNNLPYRLDQHRFGAEQKEFDRHCAIGFHDRAEAFNAERALILHLDPPLNVVKWATPYKGTEQRHRESWAKTPQAEKDRIRNQIRQYAMYCELLDQGYDLQSATTMAGNMVAA